MRPAGEATRRPGQGCMSPHRTIRVAKGAASRLLLREFLRRAGRLLLVGAVLALGLVGVDRLFGGIWPWPWLVGVPIGAALVLALLWTLARRPRPADGAAEVDRVLGLKDRLSSALVLASGGGSGDRAFAEWAVSDGDSAAQGVRLAKAIPIRADWTWWAWPATAAAGLAAALFIPAVVWSKPERTRAATPEAVTRAAALVEQAAESARDALEGETEDLATPEQLRVLEELKEQLEKGAARPEDAVARAAGELEEIAERLRAESEQQRLEDEAVAKRLASAAAPAGESEGGEGGEAEGEESDAASDLMLSFSEGDLEGAQEAAREALEQVETWTPEQRDRLARDLERMAERLEQQQQEESRPPEVATPGPGEQGQPGEQPQQPRGSEPSPGNPADPAQVPENEQPRPEGEPRPDEAQRPEPQQDRLSEEVREELQRQGVPPEQQQGLERRMTEEDARRELERRGIDPETARRMAERLARENQQREAEQSADERIEDLKRSFQDAARELREQPAEGEGRRKPQPESRPGDRQGDERGIDPRTPPGAMPAPAQRPSQREGESQQGQEQPQQGEGKQPESRPGERRGSEGQKGDPQPRPEPGAGQGQEPGREGEERGGEREVPAPAGGKQPPGEGPTPTPREGTRPQPPPETGRDGQRPEPSGKQGEQPGERRGERQGEGPDQPPQGEDSGEGQKEPAHGLERFRKAMEKFGQEAQRQQQQAERLDEQIEEMLKETSSERREQNERWDRSMTGERGMPKPPDSGESPRFDSEPVDARRPAQDKPRERVVAQWFSDKPAERGGEPGRASMDEQIQRAAQGAERAIEQQVVPGRYGDFVRRVYRRYGERAAAPAAPPTPPAGGGP